MRIIAGKAKGRLLSGPRSQTIRPALDKVKGAIFNILGDLSGLRVLDLFAGTGSVGLEALSRGALEAVFVDSQPLAIRIIHKNLKLCQFSGIVLKLPLPQGLSRLKRRFRPFDLIFVDPPYDQNRVNPSLREIARQNLLAPGGRVVVEHSPREPIREETGLHPLNQRDQRRYGQTFITFLEI